MVIPLLRCPPTLRRERESDHTHSWHRRRRPLRLIPTVLMRQIGLLMDNSLHPNSAIKDVPTLRPRRRTSETRIDLALLRVVGAFNLALAAGVPCGAAAWGGAAPDVLPVPLRVV